MQLFCVLGESLQNGSLRQKYAKEGNAPITAKASITNIGDGLGLYSWINGIDQIRLFDRQVSSSEVQEIYNQENI